MMMNMCRFLSGNIIRLVEAEIDSFSGPPAFSMRMVIEVAVYFNHIRLQHHVVRQIHFKMHAVFTSYFQRLPFFGFVQFNHRLSGITIRIVTRDKYKNRHCQKADYREI